MKNIIILVVTCTIIALIPAAIFAQQSGTYSLTTSTYQRQLIKTSSTNPTSPGLNNGTDLNVGTQSLGGSTYYYRSFYEWSIPDSVIPSGATIDSVELHYEYYNNLQGYHPLFTNLYDGAVDLVNPDLNTLWNNSQDPFHEIASFLPGSQGVYDQVYGPGSAMVYSIQHELL